MRRALVIDYFGDPEPREKCSGKRELPLARCHSSGGKRSTCTLGDRLAVVEPKKVRWKNERGNRSLPLKNHAELVLVVDAERRVASQVAFPLFRLIGERRQAIDDDILGEIFLRMGATIFRIDE